MPIFLAMLAHAQATPNRECCGLVTVPNGKLTFHACRNVASSDTEFEIHPEDYIAAEADGIVAVMHSHLHSSPEPSMPDLVGCEKSGLPWFILALPSGAYKVIEPQGYKAPLLGRPFVHGVLDCFALARDYYAEHGINVLDFERTPHWWETGGDLLTPENFALAGFRIVTDGSLQEGDGIIMQNGKTANPNHVGIYLGDGILLHHCGNRLSGRSPYGGYWSRVTRYVVRHESKC
jgi:proteasome lid subunit RPN8/RPN11